MTADGGAASPRDSGWLPFPINVRDDIPEGWVFMEDGDGRLVPMVAFRPSEESRKRL